MSIIVNMALKQFDFLKNSSFASLSGILNPECMNYVQVKN